MSAAGVGGAQRRGAAARGPDAGGTRPAEDRAGGRPPGCGLGPEKTTEREGRREEERRG